MSMAVPLDDEPIVDPDTLKVAETATHRRMVDLVGLAATTLVGPDRRVFCDMNWYPVDDGGPMAPDVMVLPADATEPEPRSYRQDQTGGPPPLAVVEVPSDSDTFESFLAKTQRYQSLGTVTYLVVPGTPRPAVLRFGADDGRPAAPEPRSWIGEPIDELGGFRLLVEDDEIVLVTPTGLRARSSGELLEDAERRIAELERQLAEGRGAEPPTAPSGD